MPKITFQPTNELVIHDVSTSTVEDLLRERVTPAGTIPLYWCDGVLFSFSSLPMTEAVVQDYMKGRLHWLEVHYATMPEFKSVLSLSEEEYKTQMNIRIIDTSKVPLHKELIKWLKTSVKM